MEKTSFNVPSISCSACSSKIQENIKAMNGVEGIEIDLKSQAINVEYNPDKVSPSEIRKEVYGLGFEIVK